MDKDEFNKKLNHMRGEKQKLINDTYLWSTIVFQSLRNSLNDKSFLNTKRFRVPSRRPLKEISRNSEQIKQIVNTAINKDFYYSLFTFIIAQVEGFLHDTIKLCLTFDNRRLKTTIQGIEHAGKIEVSEIIDSNNKEEIISNIIEKEVTSIFYSRPQKQKEYFEKVLGVSIGDILWDRWIDYKATRDIIVHNNGIINETYLSKVKKNARGQLGEQISIDQGYFDNSLSHIKTIIGKICDILKREYNNE